MIILSREPSDRQPFPLDIRLASTTTVRYERRRGMAPPTANGFPVPPDCVNNYLSLRKVSHGPLDDSNKREKVRRRFRKTPHFRDSPNDTVTNGDER
jgi:hypothetical protein